MSLSACIRNRHLLLNHLAGECGAIALDHGLCHLWVLDRKAQAQHVTETLESVSGVSVLPPEGGLLHRLTIAANWALGLCYGVESDPALRCDMESMLELGMRACGMSAQQMEEFAGSYPPGLVRLERWRAGLLRFIVRPPDLLVLERPFEGLDKRETGAVLDMIAVYREFHPWRPILVIESDQYALPAMKEYAQVIHLQLEDQEACQCC